MGFAGLPGFTGLMGLMRWGYQRRVVTKSPTGVYQQRCFRSQFGLIGPVDRHESG